MPKRTNVSISPELRLGSLFSGSGGFELAGKLCGITPAWASEIEPYPIAVTRSRFPEMKHIGDVSKINGAEIEPVNVITFGSPCQDLSIAGKRAGLKHEGSGDDETTRSGLFMEAVRIIKEMREATNGRYPTFALWENVPGAFSSNKGEDFRTVLEEIVKIVEPTAKMSPMPKDGWAYADLYLGDGWNVAYRTFDAQYWGVPQRRRRIYLVADFGGQRAGKILFEREGLRRNFGTGRTPWKGAAADAERGVGADDREKYVKHEPIVIATQQGGAEISENGVCPTITAAAGMSGNNQPWICSQVISAGFKAGQSMAGSIGGQAERGWVGEVAPTLKTSHNKFQIVYSFDSLASNSMKSKNPHSGCRRVEISKTLDASGPDPSKNQGGIAIVQAMPTMCACYDARGNGDGETAPTITGDHNNRVTDCTALICEGKPTYCLQGNGIDRADTAGCNGKGWKEDTCYTLNTIDRPAVAYAMQCSGDDAKIPIIIDRAYFNQGVNAKYEPQFYTDGTCPTLVARDSAAVVTKYIVRRLTPTECARLQGFPDKWGHPDRKDEFTEGEYKFWLEVRNIYASINGKAVKGYNKDQMLTWYNKLHTDSAEYKMWGNGIALPTALYVMQGIVDELIKEKE